VIDLDQAAAIARERAGARAPIVAISGAQGSGKSTLAARYARRTPRAVHLSLDDFYLTKAERGALARAVHPLFATRGPPGTHDIGLLGDTIGALMAAGPGARTALPHFDKAADDRTARADWPVFAGRPDLIVLEGWCLGASAQHERDLAAPINDLEAREDREGLWRRHANQHLAATYHDVFVCLDAIVFLAAPDFETVLAWRSEQEAGLLGRALTGADRARMARFVAHFERITRHMLAGGRRADLVVKLDARRAVIGA
jgi:D-glycerate 3-kinase